MFRSSGRESEGPGWDVDDDIDLADIDLPAGAELEAAGDGEGYYVAPTKAPSVAQSWSNNSQLAVDHVLAGAFESAMRVRYRETCCCCCFCCF